MLRELGSYERALFFSDREIPFHLVSVLEIDGAPTPDTLQAAYNLLFKRHPLLASRILESHGRPYFESIPDPRFELDVVSRKGNDDWVQAVDAEFRKRIDNANGPLIRCTYLFGTEGSRAEIILTCSHSVIDAVGLGLVWHELLQDSRDLQQGHLPEDATLPLEPAADALFPPAFRGASRARHMLSYMLDQFLDEVAYRRRARGQKILPMREPSPGHILTMRFSPELTNAIGRRARSGGITLNSLLNAAMLLAVNRHLYNGRAMPMRTITFASLRPYLVPPMTAPTLAPYISMLRYTVMVDPAQGLPAVARDLHNRMRSSFRRGDKFAAVAASDDLMKMLMRFRPFRMTNTGLNLNGSVGVQQAYGPISVLGLHGIPAPFYLGPEFAAQASLINRELSWDMTYLEADMDRAMAQAIAREIRSILEDAAALPRESVAVNTV